MGNNMEDIEKMLYGNLEDDEDLEAELAALQGDDPPPRKSRQKQQGMD